MKGLGDRIKSLRNARKLTLVEIAKTTGIDQATLSRIENGKMTGTLDSHMRIAEALGLRLPDLYNEVIQKINEPREKATRQKIETFSHSSGAVAELLTAGILQKKMMPVLLKVRAGGRTETEEHSPGTERFLYILKGTLEVQLGTEKKHLTSGESLYFNASTRHHFRSAGKGGCWLISVITPTSL